MNDLIEAFFARNNLTVDYKGLTELTQQLDYNLLRDFFNDNPGAVEAVVNWIGKQRVDSWKEALTIQVPENIQRLIDEGYLEASVDEPSSYVLTSTNNVVLVTDNDGARHAIGRIEVLSEVDIEFYNEADNIVKGIDSDAEIVGYKL